jgi:proline iminopeptidase
MPTQTRERLGAAAPPRPATHSAPRRSVGFARDALALSAAALTGIVSRQPVRPLADEDRRRLPGDRQLPDAKGRWTHGITIQAPPSAIWPWLLQLGCRRGGWYSYDELDNGGLASADRIHPELQQIEVGDLMAWTPRRNDGFFVAEIEPDRALVLTGDAGLYRVAWAFVLQPVDASATRLIVRASGDYDRAGVGLLLQLLWRPLHFAMERKQLLTLRYRIESTARTSDPLRPDKDGATPRLVQE